MIEDLSAYALVDGKMPRARMRRYDLRWNLPGKHISRKRFNGAFLNVLCILGPLRLNIIL